jgi:hypothetical protein
MEEFRPIKNYEDVYEVSNKGNINRILKSGKRKPMKIQRNTHNQSVITLSKKNKQTNLTLIRIVFNAFAPQHILENGKRYDLVLKSNNKQDCSIDNIEYYQNHKAPLELYEDLSDCQKFARDTKYIQYFRHCYGNEYYRFVRTVNYKTYEESWNIDYIDENLDLLKSKFKAWKEFVNYNLKTC